MFTHTQAPNQLGLAHDIESGNPNPAKYHMAWEYDTTFAVAEEIDFSWMDTDNVSISTWIVLFALLFCTRIYCETKLWHFARNHRACAVSSKMRSWTWRRKHFSHRTRGTVQSCTNTHRPFIPDSIRCGVHRKLVKSNWFCITFIVVGGKSMTYYQFNYGMWNGRQHAHVIVARQTRQLVSSCFR